MYHQHFGLQEPPFSIAVNPRYLFMSPRHREALAHLVYGVSSGGGFILLTGEVGTGKTTVNRCLLEQLPETTDVAIILNPTLSSTELLATACDELGIEYPEDNPTLKQLTDALHRFLLANHELSRRTVLMIDEAQHLDFDVLEQIRLLTNLETHDQKLLQIILIGQPELAEKLARPELRQLNQRITARYHLQPLNVAETGAYIRHRLEVAGLKQGQVLFSSAVVSAVHRRTRGIPRLINLLCDRALLGAYGARAARVSRGLVRQAADEVIGPSAQAKPMRPALGWLAMGLAAILVLTALGIWQSRDLHTNDRIAADRPTAAPAPASQTVAPTLAGWLLPTVVAEGVLWRLATDVPEPDAFCPGTPVATLMCSRRTLETWGALIGLDRPVLLGMRRPDRFAAATVVLAIEGNSAWVLLDGLREQRVPLADLAPYWTGSVTYYWHVPSGWEQPVAQGETGPVVASVAAMFATLDRRDRPLSSGEFNGVLFERVQRFQQSEGLVDDGVVGEQTLLRLNAALGTALDSKRARQRLATLRGDG